MFQGFQDEAYQKEKEMNQEMAMKLFWVAAGIVLAFVLWSYVPNLTSLGTTSNTP